MQRLYVCLLVASISAVTGGAAERTRPGAAPTDATPKLRTTVEKRVWLREQMTKGLRDTRQVREVQAKLDRLGPKHIDNLANAVLAQQLPQPDPQQVLQQAQLELARARALRQMLEQEYQAWLTGGRPVVAYAPVIGWLPEGTQLGAAAVVSADRRYVRISAMPFFSSIGPVYSYNLNTGETRLLPNSGGPPYRSPYSWAPYGYGNGDGRLPNWHVPQALPPKAANRKK